jgi:hypothetical protein
MSIDNEFSFDENEEQFPQHYDLESVFDEKIHPLLKTIVNICTEYNIPMLSTFQYKNNDDQIMLCTSVVLPPDRTCTKVSLAAQTLLEPN